MKIWLLMIGCSWNLVNEYILQLNQYIGKDGHSYLEV